MHSWIRASAFLATLALTDGLSASYAADVFPELTISPTAKLISLIPQERERR